MKRYIFLTLGVIVLVGALWGGVYVASSYQKNMINEAYVKEYNQAHALHDSGDLDKSIPAFQHLADTAPTISKATQAKLKLAFDMFSRNQGNDRANAVAVYKAVIADQSVSAFQRALTINDFLDLYQGTQDENFAKNVMFSGEPFGSFLVNGDLELAVRKAYEMGESIYPLAFTEFRIANSYDSEIRNDPSLAAGQRAEDLQQLQLWTAKGQASLPKTLQLGYEASKLGYIYQMEGMSLATIASTTDRNYTKSEEAFKQGLAAIAPETELHSYGIGLYLRFHYAAILARTDPAGRKNDILDMLGQIMQRPAAFAGKYLFFDEFIKNEASSTHDEHGHKKDLILLASISPEFKTYLSSKWGITLK